MMKINTKHFLLLLNFFLLTSSPLLATGAEKDPASQDEAVLPTDNFEKIYSKFKKSIFMLQTHYKSTEGSTYNNGSAFVVRREKIDEKNNHYHVMTNAHAVDSDLDELLTHSSIIEEIEYVLISADNQHTFDKNSGELRLVGLDPVADIAILEFNSPEEFPVCMLAESTTLRELDGIMIIGNTRGRGIGPNEGKVKNPRTSEYAYDFSVIIHDAIAASGNSGGPIFDHKGMVVGVHFRRTKDGSLHYAIPADRAFKSYQNIITHQYDKSAGVGGVKYGYWGMTIKNLSQMERNVFLPKEHQQSGILVARIYSNSPAQKAGLKEGDIIVEISGQKSIVDIINNQNMYRYFEFVRDSSNSAEVPLKIYRNGEFQNKIIKTQMRRYGKVDTYLVPEGFLVFDLIPDYREMAKIPDDLQGVVVGLPEKSNLELRLGSVIRTINGTPVKSVEEFRKVYATIPDNTDLILDCMVTARNWSADYLDPNALESWQKILIKR